MVPDAHGGRGGIAQYLRDVLQATAALPETSEIIVAARRIPDGLGGVPPKIRYRPTAASGRVPYVTASLYSAVTEPFDLVMCGHINLLPLAAVAARATGAPLVLFIYGIDAWPEHRSRVVRRALRRVDRIVSISEFTAQKFLGWAKLDASRCSILPCTVDLSRFSPGPRPTDMMDRYSLHGRKILLTVARLVGKERYKGIDEVLEVLPRLLASDPTFTYLVVGEGPDKQRLELKARSLGIDARVIFTGYVAENEKPDYFRLADAFVMPGRAEGFGIVYLEALASGIPVIGSVADASKEVIARTGGGIAVDPTNPQALLQAILSVVSHKRAPDVPGLAAFSYPAFAANCGALVHDIVR